jgi:hypothetical protein
MSATWRVASKKVCRIYLNCALPKASGRTIEKMVTAGGWVDAGKGWEGQETTLRLQGWSRSRRVILLRRRLPDTLGVTVTNKDGQEDLFWADAKAGAQV